jgi:hypothetical protein
VASLPLPLDLDDFGLYLHLNFFFALDRLSRRKMSDASKTSISCPLFHLRLIVVLLVLIEVLDGLLQLVAVKQAQKWYL